MIEHTKPIAETPNFISGSHAPAWEPVACFGMVAAGEAGLHSHVGTRVSRQSRKPLPSTTSSISNSTLSRTLAGK